MIIPATVFVAYCSGPRTKSEISRFNQVYQSIHPSSCCALIQILFFPFSLPINSSSSR